MYKIAFSPLAERDLENIWLYTLETWSLRQADIYLEELFMGFKHLAKDPGAGIDVGDIRAGYKKFVINRHLVFYKVSPTKRLLKIIRVLHEKMDFPRHMR